VGRLAAIVAIALTVAACEQATPRPSESPVPQPCAPPIVAGAPLTVTLTVRNEPIGGSVVFGLDGAFIGHAYGYPLGASRRWSLADEELRSVGQLTWQPGSTPIASRDGSRVAYRAAPPEPPGILVRPVAGGIAIRISAIDRAPYAWLDDQHVLVDPAGEPGVIRSIDIRDGSDEIVARPFAPPSPNPAGAQWDDWMPSGDLRWSILTRLDEHGDSQAQWVYDARDGRIIAPLPGSEWGLAPRGDVAISLANGTIRVMHLCDRRIVELAVRAGSSRESGWRWSPDGRYLAVAFGATSEDAGPESLVIVEPLSGRVGVVNGAWGFVHAWSPDLRHVVLGRRGYHDLASRLARIEIDGR
jgi:hypothetical protein